MSAITTVALLVFLTIPMGVLGEQRVILRCQCITKEKKPIGRYIVKMEVFPPSSHCRDTEIIATLKKDRQQVCLDPQAPWLKRVLAKKSSQQTP